MIENGVKDVFTSENFINYLSMISKFHNYSFNNVILILSQYPTASLIAGYNSWKDNFKRYVNKGEKAIKILAPYDVKIKMLKEDKDENGNIVPYEEEIQVKKFRLVNVFDISQTNGEPLPSLVNELKGTSKNAKALIHSIKDVSEIPIEMNTPMEDENLHSGAKGYYSITEDKIVVNKELEQIQIAKTLAHEYAHSLLHKNTNKESSQREIEAESLAFVICNHFGIDTSDYSFGYIASYAGQDSNQLKNILKNIQTNAKEIIDKLEPVFEKYINEPTIEQENYSKLMELAAPVLNKEAVYIQYKAPHFMNLDIEQLYDNQIAISHYYQLNGDSMADPTMEITINHDEKTAIVENYQQDTLNVYFQKEDSEYISNDMNGYLNQWLDNIKHKGYKVSKICGDDFELTDKKEIYEFCKKNKIEQYAKVPKVKEECR